jgi:hypothetical protein
MLYSSSHALMSIGLPDDSNIIKKRAILFMLQNQWQAFMLAAANKLGRAFFFLFQTATVKISAIKQGGGGGINIRTDSFGWDFKPEFVLR